MAGKRGKIDPVAVEALARIGCDVHDIAALLDCQPASLVRRHKAAFDRGRAQGLMTLRRHQWKAAEEGKVTMLIWLDRLWQARTAQQQAEDTTPPPKAYIGIDPEEV